MPRGTAPVRAARCRVLVGSCIFLGSPNSSPGTARRREDQSCRWSRSARARVRHDSGLARHRFASTTPSEAGLPFGAGPRCGGVCQQRPTTRRTRPSAGSSRARVRLNRIWDPRRGPVGPVGHVSTSGTSDVGDPVGHAGIGGHSAGHGGGRTSRRAIQDLASPGGTGVPAPEHQTSAPRTWPPQPVALRARNRATQSTPCNPRPAYPIRRPATVAAILPVLPPCSLPHP